MYADMAISDVIVKFLTVKYFVLDAHDGLLCLYLTIRQVFQAERHASIPRRAVFTPEDYCCIEGNVREN